MISRRTLLQSGATATALAAAAVAAVQRQPTEAPAAAMPDAELIALGDEFDVLAKQHEGLAIAADKVAAGFRENHPGKLRGMREGTSEFDAYWRNYTAFCKREDDALEACCNRINTITERMHELPATTLAGLVAKARTLRFNVGRMSGDDASPFEEWDWADECLERVIRDIEAFAGRAPV